MRQSVDHSQQLLPELGSGHRFLRAGLRIGQIGQGVGLIGAAEALMLLQCGIVRDPEYPAAEIGARLPASQVMEEGQKSFLHQFFGILLRDAERKQIAEEGSAQFVIQPRDFFFYWRDALVRTRAR